MKRKGLSFTLTLVVIGVVLLMTALTVIVLGTGGIAKNLNFLGGQSQGGSVAQACADLAQEIDNSYCTNQNIYVNGQDASSANCADLNKGRNPPNYVLNPNDANCVFVAAANNGAQFSGGFQPLNNVLTKNDAGNWRPIVTVNNNQYDCIKEGYMTPQCPAG